MIFPQKQLVPQKFSLLQHLPPSSPVSKHVPKAYWVKSLAWSTGSNSHRNQLRVLTANSSMSMPRDWLKALVTKAEKSETHLKSCKIPWKAASKIASLPSGSSYPLAWWRIWSNARCQAARAACGETTLWIFWDVTKYGSSPSSVTLIRPLLQRASSIGKSFETQIQGSTACFSSRHQSFVSLDGDKLLGALTSGKHHHDTV